MLGSYLLPSGNSGLILGLIFGTRAGDTSLELFALMLPRFLLPLTPFESLLSKIAEGVPTFIGDPSVGESIAEPGRAEVGVLSGPSLGVLRAVSRGVLFSVTTEVTWVSMRDRDGRREACLVAASGNDKSSSPASACDACAELWPEFCVPLLDCWLERIVKSVFGVAAAADRTVPECC